MNAFSPSDAAVEGFQVLRRHWRPVVGWAGFQIVAIVALLVLTVLLAVAIVPFASSRDTAGTAGSAIGGGLLGLGGLAIELILLCGLYRLLLRPQEPAFLHLRVGRDELRVFVATLTVLLIAVPLLVVTAAIVAAAGRVSPWLAIATAMAVLLADYALLLRFGLTPVIAFVERRISPIESWRRTRGQTWSLVGMAILRLFLLGLVAVVTWVVLFVVSGLATGFSDLNLTDTETLTAHPGRFLLQTTAELVLAPVFLVIGQAPWVAAYRALSAPAGETA